MTKQLPVAALAATALFLTATANAADAMLWDQLALIEDPGNRWDRRTREEFKRLIPSIAANCPDIAVPREAGDKAVAIWQDLKNHGIQDGLLETTEWLHVVVTGVAGAASDPEPCVGLMAMYMTARKGRYSARDSAMGIIEIYSGIHAVVKQSLGSSKPRVANEPAPKRTPTQEDEFIRLKGRVLALESALQMTIQGLSGAIGAVSNNGEPDKTSKGVQKALAEGFHEFSEIVSEMSSGNDQSHLVMNAVASTLDNLAKRLEE